MPINESLIALDLEADEEMTDAGLVLPRPGKAGEYMEGRVVATSKDLEDESFMPIRVGMVVVWRRGQAGVDLYCNGKHYHRLGIKEVHMVRIED